MPCKEDSLLRPSLSLTEQGKLSHANDHRVQGSMLTVLIYVKRVNGLQRGTDQPRCKCRPCSPALILSMMGNVWQSTHVGLLKV